MDYERIYKEIIEIARKLYNEEKAKGCTSVVEELETIFPELAESEDERIKRKIREVIDTCLNIRPQIIEEVDYLQIKKWLEKQGENPTTLPKWKYKKDNAPLLRDSLILNKYGCVAKSPSGALVSDVWVIDYDELAKLPKEEIEKQGEQKPVFGK